MQTPIELLAHRWRSAGIALTVAAVGVQTLAYVANVALFGERFEQLRLGALADGSESAYFTWMSTSATFAAGFAAFLIALTAGERRRVHALLAAILAFFSLDDLVQIHERVPGWIAGLGLPATLVGASDFLVFAPVAFVAVVLLRSVARHAAAGSRVLVNAGLVVLVASIVLDEGVRPATQRLGWRTVEAARIAAEEGLELGGMTLIATGLATVLCVHIATVAADARRAGDLARSGPESPAAGPAGTRP